MYSLAPPTAVALTQTLGSPAPDNCIACHSWVLFHSAGGTAPRAGQDLIDAAHSPHPYAAGTGCWQRSLAALVSRDIML
jgi:hypothetical protein